MGHLSETSVELTTYTFEVPEEVWDDWKEEIPRKFTPLGEGIVPLIAADAICREREGRSLTEVLITEGYLTEDELDAVMRGGLDALEDQGGEGAGDSDGEGDGEGEEEYHPQDEEGGT